jgi:hypothetical protein
VAMESDHRGDSVAELFATGRKVGIAVLALKR